MPSWLVGLQSKRTWLRKFVIGRNGWEAIINRNWSELSDLMCWIQGIIRCGKPARFIIRTSWLLIMNLQTVIRLSCCFLPNSFGSRQPVVREKFLEVRRGDDDAKLRHDQVQVKPQVAFVAVASRVSSSPMYLSLGGREQLRSSHHSHPLLCKASDSFWNGFSGE